MLVYFIYVIAVRGKPVDGITDEELEKRKKNLLQCVLNEYLFHIA